MKYETGIPNTLYISDIHAGCETAVAPPETKLQMGGTYIASEFQSKLYQHWCNCLEWVSQEFKGEKFNIIFGSELIQGRWVRLAHTLGTLPNQFAVLESLLMKIKEYVNDEQIVKSYLLHGSEAHTGTDDEYQELMISGKKTAKSLMDEFRIVPEEHRLSRLELNYKMPNGALLHGTHFFSVTNVYDKTAYQREFKEMGNSFNKIGESPPDICYRAHIHKYDTYDLSDHPRTTIGCFSTPGWQGKSPYMMKGLARTKLTQFGMCITQIENNKIILKPKLLTVKRTSRVEIA